MDGERELVAPAGGEGERLAVGRCEIAEPLDLVEAGEVERVVDPGRCGAFVECRIGH